MLDIRIPLKPNRPIKGYKIIAAMETISGRLMVRRWKYYSDKIVYFIGCYGQSSQAGDAQIEVDGRTIVDPNRWYNSIDVINHPWAGDVAFEPHYIKKPNESEVRTAMEDLATRLKMELKI